MPAANASLELRDAHRRWHKANEMDKCYMLASMSTMLRHRHAAMATATAIMQNLTNLFGTRNRATKSQAFRSIMAKIMKEATSVRDHVLEMISHLNQIEVLGGTIDPKSQVTIILQSLPPSFQQFKLNFEMNKRNYSLVELLTELQSAEDLMIQAKATMVSLTYHSSGPRSGAGKKKVTNEVIAKAAKGKERKGNKKKI
ncbi:uncharacterized protein LOC121779016 [Salvia splendens]|uniref:uncharacterized protein LOC121779016 n=1 Tax=Salvia splendens TaxID=180675 RepID=UPI001C25702F|nr:uncharacterized protein LOC121779016 [Salvia splendens]